MVKKHYRLYEGTIYKKAPDAKFTFVYCCTVKDFLMKALGNPDISEVLASNMHQITQLLSDPSCRLIKPIKIVYNLIEVLPSGVVFNIKKKSFCRHRNFVKDSSPRAFVKYEFNKSYVPYPMPFIQGMHYLFPFKTKIPNFSCLPRFQL